MVGLIQKLLLDLIESSGGATAVSEVKRRAGIPEDKTFHMDEAYDDDEWQRLLAATCEVLNLTQEQAEEAYADFFFADCIKRWPMWFQMSKSARDLLELQPRIHNGFATGIQDPRASQSINDKFQLERHNGDLVMRYRSTNQLCGLYKALARRVINHYGDNAAITEPRCLKRGDSECELHIDWA